MIKGVNKQIIEVSDPENKFFEKAVLYIRPEYADIPHGKICNSAKELVNKMSVANLWSSTSDDMREVEKKNSDRSKIVVSIAGSGLLIAGVVVLILTIVL